MAGSANSDISDKRNNVKGRADAGLENPFSGLMIRFEDSEVISGISKKKSYLHMTLII